MGAKARLRKANLNPEDHSRCEAILDEIESSRKLLAEEVDKCDASRKKRSLLEAKVASEDKEIAELESQLQRLPQEVALAEAKLQKAQEARNTAMVSKWFRLCEALHVQQYLKTLQEAELEL